MTADAEIPPGWLRAAQDAYRAAFGQAELNLAAAGLPVVIEAVRPLIEAQALGRPRTEWGVTWQMPAEAYAHIRDDEQDARAFIASMPANVRGAWRVVSRTMCHHAGPRVEAPTEEPTAAA